MENIKKLEKEFELFEKKIVRLESLKKRLNSLPKKRFGREIKSLKTKLKDVNKIEETEKEFEKLLEKIIQPYIIKFVKKFGVGNQVKIRNLKDLIRRKQSITIEMKKLQSLIEKEAEIQEYNVFKEKILARKPKKINEYVRVFVEIFGRGNKKTIKYLSELVGIDPYEMETLIERELQKLRREEELKRFEEDLEKEESKDSILWRISRKKITWDDINKMNWQKFEDFLRKLFKEMGYSVESTKRTGDQGADLIVSKFDEKIVVQAKHHQGPIGNDAIQQVHAAKGYYKCNEAIVISTSQFTKSAKELARRLGVKLWDKTKLLEKVNKFIN